MLHILRLLLLVAAVSACTPVVYGPNFQALPDLEEAGDFSIGISHGSGAVVEFMDVSAAYAFAPRMAVMLNASGAWSQYSGQQAIKGFGYYVEPAVGLFLTDIPGMRMSLYGAYGTGHQSHLMRSGSNSPILWNRFFLYPAVEMRMFNFSLAFSGRFGYLIFDRGINALAQAYNTTDSWTVIYPNRRISFTESAVTLSKYWQQFKFSMQFVLPSYENRRYPFDTFYLGVGASFVFSPRSSRGYTYFLD